MKKFKFNLNFLDRFKKKKPDDDGTETPESPDDNLNYSNEKPEEFAEKSLSNFNLKKNLADHIEESDHENLVEENVAEIFTENAEEEDTKDFKEMHGPVFNTNSDSHLPVKPEVTTKFKFKFPTFNSHEATKKLKSKFGSSNAMTTIDRLSWNDLILRLFSPYSRDKVHGLFVILLVVTLTYLTGKGIALFFNRTPPVVTVKSNILLPIEKVDTIIADVNKIASTNLFNAKESDKASNQNAKIDITSIVCLDAEKPTSESIKLMDTIVLQNRVKSVASVQLRGASDLVNVREGEQLTSAVEVAKIIRNKLILKNLNTGECEYVASEEEEISPMPNLMIVSAQKGKALFRSNDPSIKNVGNSFKIKRAFRDQMISNLSEVLTQAKAIPITNPDGSLSFKMTEVVPGSVYSKLDIQNDDIIHSINGKKIENLNELTSLLGKIREIDHFEIGLKRNGMSENKEYDFKN